MPGVPCCYCCKSTRRETVVWDTYLDDRDKHPALRRNLAPGTVVDILSCKVDLLPQRQVPVCLDICQVGVESIESKVELVNK
jgi:hypothetical protein